MLDLTKKPYFLDKERIDRIEETIKNMSLEEKIGQLFITMIANEEERKPENIKRLLNKYKPGGIRYHNASGEELWKMTKCLQENTKIPLLIASNCEAGGDGGCKEGTPFANAAALSAIGSKEAVYEMASATAKECRAVGCNWNFAPVTDLTYNWRNTIVQLRAFGDNPDEVTEYSKQFFKGMREQELVTCIKHFPGDGTEENDQHLLLGVNEMGVEEWENTFGKMYRALIDDGVMTIMAGHIALPAYQKKLNPDLRDEDIRPATLSRELITVLLKEKLGFNGLVLTDASHMIGMFGASVARSEQVPGAIAAGCDMFLFFNDKDEDFNYMLEGYKNGIITDERLNDALRRILGVKEAINLSKKKADNTLVPPKENLEVIGCKEHIELSKKLADKYITLVKDRESYLPMTTDKYKKLKLIYMGSEDMVIAGTKIKSNDEEILAELVKQLEKRGFDVDTEIPAKKGKIEEFKKKYSAVLLVFNVAGFAQFNTMRLKWDEPVKQPWYMSEVPTFVVSLSFTNMLIDVPMARCYINAYMANKQSIESLLEKMTGQAEFTGKYHENVFCKRWETRF